MSYSRQEVMGRALHFASKRGLILEEELGFGVHGIVWSTDQKSVIKAHGAEQLYYERERDIYLRLREHRVTEVLGFHVPRLLAFDDDLLAIRILGDVSRRPKRFAHRSYLEERRILRDGLKRCDPLSSTGDAVSIMIHLYGLCKFAPPSHSAVERRNVQPELKRLRFER